MNQLVQRRQRLVVKCLLLRLPRQKEQASALPFSRTSAADPVKIPLPATDTDRTPAPDKSSRHPPLSFDVTFTASPFTDSCVVRSPATVA